MSSGTPQALAANDLRVHIDDQRFSFEDTSELEPLEGVIGQRRAIDALQLGLELNAPGFNLFVCGLVGNGRAAAVKAHLEKVRPFCPLARDRAYVFNYQDPRSPRLLTFPRGVAHGFAREMDQLVLLLVREIPEAEKPRKIP